MPASEKLPLMMTLTSMLGLSEGDAEGDPEGEIDGLPLGNHVGLVLGDALGDVEGDLEGLALGEVEGEALGLVDGETLGDVEGEVLVRWRWCVTAGRPGSVARGSCWGAACEARLSGLASCWPAPSRAARLWW